MGGVDNPARSCTFFASSADGRESAVAKPAVLAGMAHLTRKKKVRYNSYIITLRSRRR
jgi:hypothetical protein